MQTNPRDRSSPAEHGLFHHQFCQLRLLIWDHWQIKMSMSSRKTTSAQRNARVGKARKVVRVDRKREQAAFQILHQMALFYYLFRNDDGACYGKRKPVWIFDRRMGSLTALCLNDGNETGPDVASTRRLGHERRMWVGKGLCRLKRS